MTADIGKGGWAAALGVTLALAIERLMRTERLGRQSRAVSHQTVSVFRYVWHDLSHFHRLARWNLMNADNDLIVGRPARILEQLP